MKAKLDFVTNSSSVCYLISLPKRLTKITLKLEGIKNKCINDFLCTNKNTRLIQYIDQEPCDWIKKATGPTKFYYASKEWYDLAKAELDNGEWVLFIDLERNYYDECIVHFEEILDAILEGKILAREFE